MKHGPIKHVSQLVLGDVVRRVAGGAKPIPTPTPHVRSYEEKLADAINRGLIPEVGGADDFRQGYDAMTVVAVSEVEMIFHRPHVHVYEDHDVRTNKVSVGVEIVKVHLAHGGMWFELLSPSILRSREQR